MWDNGYGETYDIFEMRLPRALRFAKITGVGPDTIQHIHEAKALRCLILVSTRVSICQIPGSVWQLPNLEHLEIDNRLNRPIWDLPFVSLGEVPKFIRLKILEIENCDKFTELPESLGRLSALSKLSIGRCSHLRRLPASLGQLSALSELRIWICPHITELPESLGQLRALKVLSIELSRLKKLPESIGQIRNLERLRLLCGHFEGLPESFGQLQSLKRLAVFSEESGTPDISALLGRFCFTSLEFLWIDGFETSNRGAFIDQARALQSLTLRRVGPEELPISVTGLVKHLSIENCVQREIAVLPNSLESLHLWNCHNLVKLPDFIGQLSGLRELTITYCRELGEWRPSSAVVGANLQELVFQTVSSGDLSKYVPALDVKFSREDLFKLAIERRSLREGAMQKDAVEGDNNFADD